MDTFCENPRIAKSLLLRQRADWFAKIICLFVFIINSIDCSGQRNLFDIPTSEIVEFRQAYVQGQAVFTSEEVNTSATATFGLGYNFEIGITLNQLVFIRSEGVKVDAEKPEENPDLLINAQKAFRCGTPYPP